MSSSLLKTCVTASPISPNSVPNFRRNCCTCFVNLRNKALQVSRLAGPCAFRTGPDRRFLLCMQPCRAGSGSRKAERLREAFRLCGVDPRIARLQCGCRRSGGCRAICKSAIAKLLETKCRGYTFPDCWQWVDQGNTYVWVGRAGCRRDRLAAHASSRFRFPRPLALHRRSASGSPMMLVWV